MEQNKKSGLTKMISALVVIAIAAFAWFKMKGDDSAPIQTTETPASTNPSTSSGQLPAAIDRKYKDGSYTATGMYQSPAGTENVQISLVVKNDTIVSGTFLGKAVNPTSIKMQGQFSAGFNSYVVGKKIDDIQVMAVNGSSLTPKGFMDALVKIKAQAQS